VSTFEIVGLVVVGVGFLGLIAFVARHARQWDDD
jgi:Tfp pilus assembly protein PilV